MYVTLRDELVADPLTAGQPEFAAQHLKRVGQTAAPVLKPMPTFAHWLQCQQLYIYTNLMDFRCWTTTSLAASSTVAWQ